MFKNVSGGSGRHRTAAPYINPAVANILKMVEEETRDHALVQSIVAAYDKYEQSRDPAKKLNGKTFKRKQ